MASRMICKYKLYCVRPYLGHLKSSQRTRALSKKWKHKCGERTCPCLSMSVITWPSPDMAISEVIMITFEEWVSVLFDFNYNFMFSTSKSYQKSAWKPANALVAANKCLKLLGLKYLVQTPNVFAVASPTGSLSKSVHRSLLRQVCPRQSSE